MLKRLRLALVIYLFWVGFFLLARVGFLVYHRFGAGTVGPRATIGIFAAGLRLDLSAAAYLSAVPLVLLALSTYRPLQRIATWSLTWWLGLGVIAMTLLVVADLELALRWGRRIDATVIQYLATPAEAWASAGASPLLWLGVCALAVVSGSLRLLRRMVSQPLATLPSGHWLTPLPGIAILGLLFIAARGGIQTWPLTASSAYHSTIAFANLAAQNAAWGFFDSIYRRTYDRTNPFHSMADSTATGIIAEAHRESGPRRPAPVRLAKPNVLLIIWESASARAFGSLGGVSGVTPHFDSLAKTGILFRRFYAAGDRTDKGIAASLSGFPGIPRGSVLTVPSKTRSLPFVSAQFRSAGYATSFYYGGELEFASLQAYLVSANFDRVVGKEEFPRVSRNSKWGAHDGVVARRLLDDLNQTTTPFLSVWLTLSSHEPFETPVPVTISGTDWQSRFFNSLAYTDQVLGNLLASASQEPWWNNTLVVIVADHGKRLVPLDGATPNLTPDGEYRIPMLWVGGALTRRDSIVDEIGSQLDIAPTLVDLIGGNPAAFGYGRSLLRTVAQPHAYYGFDEGFGIVTDSGAIVYDRRANRIAWQQGRPTGPDFRLGRALLQQSYQEYLDR